MKDIDIYHLLKKENFTDDQIAKASQLLANSINIDDFEEQVASNRKWKAAEFNKLSNAQLYYLFYTFEKISE
jgi:hypothetical protein